MCINDYGLSGGGGGISCVTSSACVTRCTITGNSGKRGSGVLNWDASNGDADPLFADADGPDDDPDTIGDNNYRLSAGSPCIDSGSNAVLPTDTTDVDRDDVTLELLPEDLDGNHRLWDDPATPDSGEGTPPIVDRGVYEYGSIPPAPVLLAAESLKQHGSVGSFGISVTGSQAVEPR
ncbi:MAG: hypothetical protein GXY55_16500 [Phycisphaerae bacterium]|nr:hypothetical protein [Phycisphaerae bacterium]